MKRLIFIFAGCLLAAAASAQTLPQGTILVNPTLTNLSFNAITISNEGQKESFSRFGLQATGGYAIMDDIAVLAGVGLQSGVYDDSSISVINLSAGARYYVIPNVYVGANALIGSASIKNNVSTSLDDDNLGIDTASIKANTFSVELNAGYTYFLTNRFAVEPSLSYTLGLSTKIQDIPVNLSMFSLNLGFLFLL